MPEVNIKEISQYTDPSTFDNIDANTFASTVDNTIKETSSNNNQKGTKKKTLSYPLARRNDSKTDYLQIEIADYKAPGLNLPAFADASGNRITDKYNITDKTVVGSVKPPVFGEGAGSFALTQGSTTNNFGRKTQKEIKYVINLPMPRNITDTTGVQYGEASLNPIEAVGAALISQGIENPTFQRVQDTFNLLSNEGLDVINMNTDAIAAAIAGRAIGALGGNVTANSLLARATGAILNPNLESLFQGVKLRQFPFVFEFFPRNGREAEEVKNIIKVLKRSMAPRNNRKKGNGVFIKQPDIFQLQYLKGGLEHPFLNKFLPMHLTDMKINYSSSGTYSTFWDGTPSHMTASCSFTEVNPVYQEDYDEAGKGVGY